MKRIRAWYVSIFTAGYALALAPACGTGNANPGTGGAGGSTTTGSTSTSTGTNPTTTGSTSNGNSSSSGGFPAQTGVCKGAGTRVLTNTMADAFIDDFEEAVISPGWSSFSDVPSMLNVAQIMQVTGGAAGTNHSGQYMGSGATTSTMNGYGVGTVYNTAIDPGAGIYCVDISAFTGVSFWAKAGTAGSMISLNFVLPNTNMATQTDAGMQTGGDCTTNCFNHPRVTFTLTADWKQYTAPFAQAAGGSATVENVIQEIAFLSPDSDWNFSLDEVAFYSGTPPAGAVGNCTTDNTCDGG
jgi:hypothetical protein